MRVVIDCDVHNAWTSSRDLLPYLSPYFRDFLERGELPGGRDSFPHGHRPWLHPEGFTRTDSVPETGATPGSDYELLREQLLDRYDVEYAILTGDEAVEASTLANAPLASALVAAANDWTLDEWIPRDERLRASLVVAPQDPHGAAAEVRRHGGNPAFVQVLVSTGSQRPYGDPFYHPIWDAAAEVGLPIAAHLGGQGGINANPTGCGPPTFFWEAHALLCETGMGHIGSLIAHGVFERWPNLKFVLIEAGVAWLPAVLWRLDADYKALRKETPWLKRLPSEYARDHVRLTTQPLEQPKEERHLLSVLEAIDGEHTLLFASDYPHWDFDDPDHVRIPHAWRERVMSENARELYGLPRRSDRPAEAARAAA
ncbi:MAG: amidohydrolase family protein [Actinobacteria bacterium]|nr:amidohydrolase family protein [Actinomycetota bacterium]